MSGTSKLSKNIAASHQKNCLSIQRNKNHTGLRLQIYIYIYFKETWIINMTIIRVQVLMMKRILVYQITFLQHINIKGLVPIICFNNWLTRKIY